MSTPIKNVTLIGANGTIGGAILKALLATKVVEIQVLTRPTSSHTFPSHPNLKVQKADYTSHNDLVSQLRGQDAVICTLADDAVHIQFQIIEAAFEAGVRRFIPNEWGSHDIPAPVPEMEPSIPERKAVIALLDEKSKVAEEQGKDFHWTGINCGVFFDWALYASFLDITLPPSKTALIWDEGTNTFSATNLETVVKAVVVILADAEKETRNRFVYIQNFATSQQEILDVLEKVRGEKWVIERTSAQEQFEVAGNLLKAGDETGAFYIWLRGGLFSGSVGCEFEKEKLDNELLGLQRETLEETVRRVLA